MSPKSLIPLVVLLSLVACQEKGQPVSPAPAPAPGGSPEAVAVAGKAPENFRVRFETSCGDFVIEAHRAWAPIGVDRFHTLVTKGFFDECRFFRVAKGFVVQFGLNGDPTTNSHWANAEIRDDPVKAGNKKKTVCFATAGPNTRTSQLFINLKDNGRLDGMGFAAFGEVVEGWETVEKINGEYGESPDQGRINAEGNAYLNREFPRLDYIRKATVLP